MRICFYLNDTLFLHSLILCFYLYLNEWRLNQPPIGIYKIRIINEGQPEHCYCRSTATYGQMNAQLFDRSSGLNDHMKRLCSDKHGSAKSKSPTYVFIRERIRMVMGDGLPKVARIAGTAMRSLWIRMKHFARSDESISGSWSAILFVLICQNVIMFLLDWSPSSFRHSVAF